MCSQKKPQLAARILRLQIKFEIEYNKLMKNRKYENVFTQLSDQIENLIKQVQGKKLSDMATKEWSVKDVLCHIVFWHENYAANYQAMADHKTPPLLFGSITVINPAGVKSLHRCSLKELIQRLQKAQGSLYQNIVEKQISKMTYKLNSRTYTTPEFLKAITGHVFRHAEQIRKAK